MSSQSGHFFALKFFFQECVVGVGTFLARLLQTLRFLQLQTLQTLQLEKTVENQPLSGGSRKSLQVAARRAAACRTGSPAALPCRFPALPAA